MSYFSDNYRHVSYPNVDPAGGLYRAQLGAIHRIAAHFTLDEEPALITMPTGSGKTAVLMMTPFVLQAERVLVVTPSRMVREQIAEDFAGLVTLRKAQVIPAAVRSPKVKELKSRINDAAEWETLREAEVVISTPNCTSPGYQQIPIPPADLFDLVLIDEAHHSSARTWAELLDAFPSARRVLFTATPFRRDRGEIKAKYIYTYPIERAFRDGIFGKIRYVPVALTPQDASADIAIATKAETVFAADRAAGLKHYVMVRTDTRTRANELVDVYHKHTKLRLGLIHSGISNKRVKDIITRLDASELDGIICVNMLGEGFNFPRLKIAAIHAPHRSLEVTLQFVGRFARTNAVDIGEAKFVAVLNDIELEGARLFDESSVWQEVIQDLSYQRVSAEVEVREQLDEFEEPDTEDPDLTDLSLYSLHPRSHVKIYDVDGEEVHLSALEATSQAGLPGNIEVRYHNITSTNNVAVVIGRQRTRPKWSATDKILDSENILIVVFHDTERNLVFVNASISSEGLYASLRGRICPAARALSMSEVMRVVRRLRHQRIFNHGMRNIQATNAAESYRIVAGPDTQLTMRPSDAHLYRQGHVYMTGDVNGEKVTIGYSSGSKVWAAAQHRIPGLLAWCRAVGKEIRDPTRVVTNSGLDFVPTGQVVTELPQNIVLVQWHGDVFALENPARVEYVGDDGKTHRPLLMDLDIQIDRTGSTKQTLALIVTGQSLTYRLTFSLSEEAEELYEPAAVENVDRIRVVHESIPLTLLEYLNVLYLDMYTADGGVLSGNELIASGYEANPINPNQLEMWDWSGTDITSEVVDTAKGQSVHSRVRAVLAAQDADVVFSDHGSGEIADFVSVKRVGEVVEFKLYHCKGSSEEQPGSRVADGYEVCGQAQKSVPWRSLPRIVRRLSGRTDELTYVKGDEATLLALLQDAGTKRQEHQVAVVQPGISAAKLSKSLRENLGATSDHLVAAGFAPLRIIVSA